MWQELSPKRGDMLRLAVVGGTEQDLSWHQLVLNTAFRELRIDSEVLSLNVPKEEFEECVRHLESIGFRGVSVAHPYKVDAAKNAERFWVARFALGVANTLLFEGGSIFAQNTEVPAIMGVVKHLEAKTALVMGTGHAARSVVAALLQSGWKTRVWNRNANKSKVLITLLQRHGEIEMVTMADPTGCHLVVNATPLGARAGEIPPLIWQRVLPRTVFLDLVFRRVPTDMLRTATVRGLKAIDGRELFVEQMALALEWWTNQEAPRKAMCEAAGVKGL